MGTGAIRGNEGGRDERTRRIDEAQKWFAKRPYMLVAIDQRVSWRAFTLATEYDLSGSDACILAAAEFASCEILYTWDKGLLKVGDQLGSIAVCEPGIPTPPQDELPLEL